MTKHRYTRGGDAKLIEVITKTRFDGFDHVIEQYAWSERGSVKMREVQTRLAETCRTLCVRKRTDFRYSNTLGWNTFPVPTLTEKNKADLTACAEDILLAREAHFPATIADLYYPEKMPENLRAAHDRNDETLERIYIGRRFKNDTGRLEKLFEVYTKMTTKPKARA